MEKEIRFGDEILRQIDGFPDYAVSNKGFVYRNFTKGLLPDSYRQFRMKTFKNKNGYHIVQLSHRGKRKVFYLHRLVALYFVPNEKNYRFVVHIDGNKDNNSYDNLRWVPAVKKAVVKNTDKKDILSISINPQVKEKLIKLAEEKGVSVSALIEEAVKKYLEG
ncbi:HNH endonuclease [Persephonella sp.]